MQYGPGAGFALVFLFVFLVVSAAWLFAAYWVYTDAKRRGSPNAEIWGIAVFLIGFLGLLLYLLVRDDMGGRPSY